MTDKEKVAAFLHAHIGFYFCSFCISREVNLDAFSARNIVWALQANPEYHMHTTKCVSCMRLKRVIAAVGGFALLGPEAHVVVFLLANKGFAYCDACLALANELSLVEAQRLATYLQPLPEFERVTSGECSVCGRMKAVISAPQSATDIEARLVDPHAVLDLGSATVHYREWRIEVLSYRIAGGWRPFVVIQGPDNAAAPQAATLWDPVSTKPEADAYAVAKAREWIDRRFR